MTDLADQAEEAAADISGDVFKVFLEIAIIHQLSRAQFERVMPDGLLTSHFGVLSHLHRMGDGKSLSYLAFAFQVTKGTMTNTVQKLEQRRLVEVRPDPKDGRGKRVFITQAGRATLGAAVAALTPHLGALVERVGADTFDALLPHLATVRAALDEMRNVDKPDDD